MGTNAEGTGTALLIAAAPVGKGRLVHAGAVLPALSAVPAGVLTGAAAGSVVQLADPADPNAVLAQLRTAAGEPGPLLLYIVGQLHLDRRRQEPHVALARTTPQTVRYTALPWQWIADALRERRPGTTTVFADLVADDAAWAHLADHPLALPAFVVLHGVAAHAARRRRPGVARPGVPLYTLTVAELLRSCAVRPPLDELHRHAAERSEVLAAGAVPLGAGPDAVLPVGRPDPGTPLPQAWAAPAGASGGEPWTAAPNGAGPSADRSRRAPMALPAAPAASPRQPVPGHPAAAPVYGGWAAGQADAPAAGGPGAPAGDAPGAPPVWGAGDGPGASATPAADDAYGASGPAGAAGAGPRREAPVPSPHVPERVAAPEAGSPSDTAPVGQPPEAEPAGSAPPVRMAPAVPPPAVPDVPDATAGGNPLPEVAPVWALAPTPALDPSPPSVAPRDPSDASGGEAAAGPPPPADDERPAAVEAAPQAGPASWPGPSGAWPSADDAAALDDAAQSVDRLPLLTGEEEAEAPAAWSGPSGDNPPTPPPAGGGPAGPEASAAPGGPHEAGPGERDRAGAAEEAGVPRRPDDTAPPPADGTDGGGRPGLARAFPPPPVARPAPDRAEGPAQDFPPAPAEAPPAASTASPVSPSSAASRAPAAAGVPQAGSAPVPDGGRPEPAAPADPHPAILRAARAGRHTEAAAAAAAWEQYALHSHGYGSREATHWLEVRADLARLAEDPGSSCELWMRAARARLTAAREPADSPDVEADIDRAHHQWTQVRDPAVARALSAPLLALRQQVPGRRPGALRALEQRIASLPPQ